MDKYETIEVHSHSSHCIMGELFMLSYGEITSHGSLNYVQKRRLNKEKEDVFFLSEIKLEKEESGRKKFQCDLHALSFLAQNKNLVFFFSACYMYNRQLT
eukprot:gb/GEZN01033363.1/.p1 GENE.gb/GEZN01033363.1/~~gb/GEZN01033363.1/.p1  ORF type:complete len:100 (+),score=8.05 gb/GEZN01033363.1/:77-376(+)